MRERKLLRILKVGNFAALTLNGGMTISGYAGEDPDRAGVLRIDGLALEDDGSVSQFSLRLEQSQIQAATVLNGAPTVSDGVDRIHRMRAAFWADME